MREFDNLANIEELLPLALAQTEPSSDFVNRLRIRLQQAAAVTKSAAVPARRLRWAWVLAFIFLVLLGSMLALGAVKYCPSWNAGLALSLIMVLSAPVVAGAWSGSYLSGYPCRPSDSDLGFCRWKRNHPAPGV